VRQTQIVWTVAASTSIFFSRWSAPKPMYRPSGDQKALSAPSVPASRLALVSPTPRSHADRPFGQQR
jgi:hypothetical protein